MPDLTMIQRFKQARAAFDESVQDVADKLGFHRNYIYECLKYPNKNPELHQQIRDYIASAGIDVPADSKLETTNQ